MKSAVSKSASEVVQDASQLQTLKLQEDSPELAALVREGVGSRHHLHRKGDVRKLLGLFQGKSKTLWR